MAKHKNLYKVGSASVNLTDRVSSQARFEMGNSTGALKSLRWQQKHSRANPVRGRDHGAAIKAFRKLPKGSV
jgi:hypothetical protein